MADGRTPTRVIGEAVARRRERAEAALEVVLGVAVATVAVALLHHTAPAGGLGVLYLPAVLALAIRRGQLAAVATALLGVLTLNYLYIAPRHQLAIAHSQDVVELIVLMSAAVVVGRLAAASRARAAEAESRASLAARREREASLLANAASVILAGPGLAARLATIEVSRGEDAPDRVRIGLDSVPAPGPDEVAVPLRSRSRGAWLYVPRAGEWPREDLERVAGPLGRLIDVGVERERLAELAAETEAGRRADDARRAILHAVSHDIRTPLTAIATAAAAMRGRAVTDAERNELIEVIEAESARLARLIGDLLDLSRIEAGAVAPRPDWCDLADVVSSAAASLGTPHPIEFLIPDDLPLVRADAAQLERVFSNLLDNAIKFSPPGTAVRVTAGAGAGRVTVRVLDAGRGIPAQHQTRVFEPFFRGREAGAPGSGLGLAICRGFVQANGGQIVLQSGGEGGTSFAVSFALAPQPEAAR